MVKWLVIIVAGYLLFKMFSGDRRKKVQDTAKTNENLAATGEMVKDPVCGTFVPVDSGIRVREGSTVHSFCSYECRDKFLKQLQASEAEPVEAKAIPDEDKS